MADFKAWSHSVRKANCKTPEVTCADQKLQRFRCHIIHKCTQMYLFIKEPVCDTDDSRQSTTDNRLTHFKLLSPQKLLSLSVYFLNSNSATSAMLTIHEFPLALMTSRLAFFHFFTEAARKLLLSFNLETK